MHVSLSAEAEAVLAPGLGGLGCWDSERLEEGRCSWATMMEGESLRMWL